MPEDYLQGSILGLDIKSYSSMAEPDQVSAQRVLERVLNEATERSGVKILDHDWLDGGDGGFFILQGDLRSALAVVEGFVPLLAEENRVRRDENMVHVRFAMHSGAVTRYPGRTGRKFSGDAINDTARLLNGMRRDYLGQVVCSGSYKAQLERAQVHRDHFKRLKDIVDKHDRVHEVWNVRRAPGFGVEPLNEDLHPGL